MKMFRKKTKKGFTIVELVIVIAVIAILSAVLIPTFAGLIKKAEISSDQTLVRNLNTSLAISSEGGGTKKLTMYETLEGMKEQGYVVDKLTPTHSKNNIVWDSENNQFVLVYENGDTYTGTTVDPTVDKSKMWKIYTEIPTESEYSVYLAGTNVTGNVEVKGVGFDAGENVGISTVTYKNEPNVAKDVVIRTNSASTILTVDAEEDTVYHYGEAGFLNVIKVNTASYHEFGYVPQAQISQGRIVNEAGSVETEDGETKQAGVENLFIVAANESSFNEVIVAAVDGAKLPALDRTDVTIPDGGVLVVEVQEVSNDTVTDSAFIYLYKSGVKQQIVVSDEKLANITGSVKDGTVKGVLADGTEINVIVSTNNVTDAATKKAAIEVANILKGGDHDISGDDLDSKTLEVEEKATLADLEKSQGENALFAGGAGTEGNPYLIATVEHFANIDSLSDLMSTKPIYFKQTENITITDDQLNSDNDVYLGSYGFKNLIHTFQGKYDGNSYSLEIKIDSTSSGWIFDGLEGNVEICNLNIKHENIEPLALLGTSSNAKNVKLLNINIYGKENYIYSGPLLYCNMLSCDAEYINCTNYVNYKFSAYQGGIFVSTYFGGASIKVLFDNCINYGSIRGGSAAFFNGNGNGKKLILVDDLSTVVKEASNKYICVKNCANKGSIIGTTNCEPFCRYAEGAEATSIATANNEVLANFSKGNMSTSNISDYSLSANGNELVLNKSSNSSAVKYVLSTKFSGSVKFPSGKSAGSVVATVKQEFDNNNFKFITSAYLSDEFNNAFGIQYSSINSNEFSDGLGFKYKIAQVDGKNIAVFDIAAFNKANGSYGSGSLSKTPFFELYVYGTNDELLSVTTYSLSDFIK